MVDGDDPPTGWEALPPVAAGALESAWDCGVPGLASALHARWWQLETWLRTLAYVELRTRYGPTWLDQVPARAVAHARSEARLAHMTSPDANLILSYFDISDLFEVVKQHWDLFAPSLIDLDVWEGRVRELKQIRHRIAHCRRPHQDDIPRLEQTLRDLDPGAVRAILGYNTRYECDTEYEDPIVAQWIRKQHELSPLVDHADSSYRIAFNLTFSRRPWTNPLDDGQSITGQPGYLWHARFYMAGRGVHPRRLWDDPDIAETGLRERVLFLCLDGPSRADFAFPAVSDTATLADDIGRCLRAILDVSRPIVDYDRAEEMFATPPASLDPRIQIATPWAFLGEHTMPISIFCG
jgi:hypothetical protein